MPQPIVLNTEMNSAPPECTTTSTLCENFETAHNPPNIFPPPYQDNSSPPAASTDNTDYVYGGGEANNIDLGGGVIHNTAKGSISQPQPHQDVDITINNTDGEIVNNPTDNSDSTVAKHPINVAHLLTPVQLEMKKYKIKGCKKYPHPEVLLTQCAFTGCDKVVHVCCYNEIVCRPLLPSAKTS